MLLLCLIQTRIVLWTYSITKCESIQMIHAQKKFERRTFTKMLSACFIRYCALFHTILLLILWSYENEISGLCFDVSGLSFENCRRLGNHAPEFRPGRVVHVDHFHLKPEVSSYWNGRELIVGSDFLISISQVGRNDEDSLATLLHCFHKQLE